GVVQGAGGRHPEIDRAALSVAELEPDIAVAARLGDRECDLDLGLRRIGLHVEHVDLRRRQGGRRDEEQREEADHRSKSVMLSTCAVCGNMLATPAATRRKPWVWTNTPASRASVAGSQET